MIGLYKAECTRDGSPFRDGPVATVANLEKITALFAACFSVSALDRRHIAKSREVGNVVAAALYQRSTTGQTASCTRARHNYQH
jgi:hypothetical protein